MKGEAALAKTLRDETPNPVPAEDGKRGRPRVWENPAARQRAHRQRQAAVTQATRELIHAALNAAWADPTLQQQLNAATDDLTVLQALTAYYRARHWLRSTLKA